MKHTKQTLGRLGALLLSLALVLVRLCRVLQRGRLLFLPGERRFQRGLLPDGGKLFGSFQRGRVLHCGERGFR